MKDFSPSVVLAILSEIFGPELWVLVGVAVFVFALGIVFAVQGRRLTGDRVKIAIAISTLAALAFASVAPTLTHAGFANIHGLLDWSALALIAVGGFMAALWISYLGLSRRP